MDNSNDIAYIRNYGIDILRIVSMYLIIILHLLGHGKILVNCELMTLNYQIAWGMELAAYCAVNCFCLISGYVGVYSRFKYSNLIYLYMQVIFYTVTITLIFQLIFPDSVMITDIIKAFFPPIYGHYWYFSAYFGMYFLIPYINKMLLTLNKNSANVLLRTVIIIFSFLPTIFRNNNLFGLGGGYSLIWMLLLYLIGGCLQILHFADKLTKRQLISLYMFCVLSTWINKIFGEFLNVNYNEMAKNWISFVSYVSPTILFSAIALLLLFSKIEPKVNSKTLIRRISPLSFSVYLIHDNPLVRKYFISAQYVSCTTSTPFLLILTVLSNALLIFIVCVLIDSARFRLFEVIKLKTLCINIEQKITKILHRTM